jgi:GNAT superfamily N-acetyltransferase
MTEAAIRSYRPADHSAARALWVEFVEQHRELYGTPQAAGDPGTGFEEYLTRLDLSGVWVAEDQTDGVVGLIGLIMRGRVGEVEPIVVSAAHRGSGIGRALLDHVAEQARKRSLARLTITPESRNVSALRSLHAAGYDVLSAVELSLDLRAGSSSASRSEGADIELMGLRFRS